MTDNGGPQRTSTLSSFGIARVEMDGCHAWHLDLFRFGGSSEVSIVARRRDDGRSRGPSDAAEVDLDRTSVWMTLTAWWSVSQRCECSAVQPPAAPTYRGNPVARPAQPRFRASVPLMSSTCSACRVAACLGGDAPVVRLTSVGLMCDGVHDSHALRRASTVREIGKM